MNIEKVVRCKMPLRRSRMVPPIQITPFTDQVKLSVRDISRFSSDRINYTYCISRGSDDASLIFTSKNFSRSSLMNGAFIAICVEDMLHEVFIMKFSQGPDRKDFLHNFMSKSLQNDLKCPFPLLTTEEIKTYLTRS